MMKRVLSMMVLFWGLVFAAPSSAQAQDCDFDFVQWGVVGVELGAAVGVPLMLGLHDDGDTIGALPPILLTLGVISSGLGLGWLSHEAGWTAEGPRVIQGALGMGGAGFLAGMMVEHAVSGRMTPEPGYLAYGLGLAGAVTGAWFGATQVGCAATAPWNVGAVAGGLLGLVAGGMIGMIVFYSTGSDRAFTGAFGWTMFTLVSAGLTFGIASALSEPGDPGEPAAMGMMPLQWQGRF